MPELEKFWMAKPRLSLTVGDGVQPSGTSVELVRTSLLISALVARLERCLAISTNLCIIEVRPKFLLHRSLENILTSMWYVLMTMTETWH